MRGRVQRIGRVYSGNVMKNIGIFLFIGLISVIFHDEGWFPNENMYRISQLAYVYVVPIILAYEGGRVVGGGQGGGLAVLGICGVLAGTPSAGILGAMFYGPLGGLLWKYGKQWLDNKIPSGLQMLIQNLLLAALGAILAGGSYYLMAPVLNIAISALFQVVQFLVDCRLTGILSILIEPAKVFFLNNLLNHGILLPLGMNQVQEFGNSVLFLLEANPGPGLGLLLAMYYRKKQAKNVCLSAMFTEAIGGVHEVYFPFVLSNIKLIVPLILGGMVGNFWFGIMDCGLQGAVSPGSIVVITLMAGKRAGIVLIGILLSLMISFLGSIVLLDAKIRKDKRKDENEIIESEEKKEENMYENIKIVGFVCDGGMGSSAMGATLFRRVLKENHIEGIEVKAFASDLIPEEIDLLVCQKDFYEIRSDWQKNRKIYLIDNFVNKDGYIDLAKKLG